MNERLQHALRKLRLSGLAESLQVRLEEAAASRLTHAEFLELILQDELAVRGDRQIQRRTKAAAFREVKTLGSIRFLLQSLDQPPAGVRTGHLPLHPRSQGRPVAWTSGRRKVLPGPGPGLPGDQVGLSRLLPLGLRRGPRLHAGRGVSAARTRCWPSISSRTCSSLTTWGSSSSRSKSGEFLFEIIMRRYELKSTMMTSNRPLEDWGKLIGDVPAASAILDRFLHHAEVINITGKSYRMRDRQRTEPQPPEGKKRRDRPRSDEADAA